MIEKLLKLRLKDYVEQLSGSKSNQQRAVLWTSLTDKFKLTFNDQSINVLKLQKKYASIKVKILLTLEIVYNYQNFTTRNWKRR